VVPSRWQATQSQLQGILFTVSVVEPLLTLLLGDAAGDDFDTAVAQALVEVGAQTDADTKLSLRREVDLLVEARAMVDRHRRRTYELRGLFETAGDLSSLRDVETVLQAIVRRGRQLLTTDVAYLMLIDVERGDTYMRVTEGTVAPDFINIRLPLGVGLGGLVAKNIAPHWTSNYLEDHRYLHVIDGIVTEEHLVAILGVPLKVGRRLIGVLFAADREPRTFTQEEVSLLSSLADHAAIAIENASLFQETRASMRALTTAKATIEQNNDRLRRAGEMHERLMTLVLDGGVITHLADAVVEVMGGAVLVVDSDGSELARAGTSPAGSKHEVALHPDDAGGEIADLLDQAGTLRRALHSRLHGFACLVAPVVAGEDYFGALLFVDNEITEVDARSLERAATIMALLLLNRQARDEADNRVRGELLAELLISSVRDAAGVHRRARLLEVDLAQDLTVVVAVPKTRSVSKQLSAEASATARSMHGLVTTQSDRVVMLIPDSDPEGLASTISRRIRSVSPEVTIGTAGPVRDLGRVAEFEDQAHRCAKVLEALGKVGEGVSTERLGIYGLLLSEAGQEQVRSLVTSTIGPIQDYDRTRGTALLPTLQAYFYHEGHVAAAARELFVHVNTMYQRLDRMDKLLGADWRTGDRALEIRLAVRLQRLSR